MKRKKILFVCTGNTCRSPMAEAILRYKIKHRKIKWWDVISSGIQADVGGTISDYSKKALSEICIDVGDFKPRQLTQKLIAAATLVVTMTPEQKQLLEDCGNVICVSDVCGLNVPDPYGGSLDDYRRTREILSLACENLIEQYILNFKE